MTSTGRGRTRKVPKQFRLDPSLLRRARRALRAPSDTAAVERALRAACEGKEAEDRLRDGIETAIRRLRRVGPVDVLDLWAPS
ncbi:MAG: hypothetical protein L0323_11790 [Planctomycetes bacterium]|nr:hypothetical protein [Planctomycetota bacterium]